MTRVWNMSIDGRAVGGAGTFDVVDPATESVCAVAPECSSEQLDAAMSAARRAFPGWADGPELRRRALVGAADLLDDALEELAATLTMEQGKPLAEARGECAMLPAALRSAAELDLPEEVVQDDERAYVAVRRRPLGVVAAIIPWNAPVALTGLKLSSNVAAGNTMVLKPSPHAPLTVLRIGEIVQRALPPGVLNVVSGAREDLGRLLCAHPLAAKVSMTGSIGVGKAIAAAAAPDLKRVTLELGGNDPAIVLSDVDIDDVAPKLVTNSFANCGQICIAIKRVYAHESIAAELTAAVAAHASKLVVGNGADVGTQIGPLATAEQRAMVASMVDEAVASGAVVETGGAALDRPGYFYAPTVLSSVTDDMRVVHDEQFGPVLPIVSVGSVDEAVERANGTTFGLGSSVWSRDLDAARAVARRIEAGTTWINTHRAKHSPMQPLSGWKWSGLGIEGGVHGLLDSTAAQVVHEARS